MSHNCMHYNMRPLSARAKNKYEITYEVPRYVSFENNTEATFSNHQFNFKETYFYLKGDWELILKKHGEIVYLQKRRYYKAES